MKFAVCSFVIGGSVLVLLGAWRNLCVVPSASRSSAAIVARPRAVENYGKLPLAFELNRGQTDAQVRFLARGEGYTLFLTPQQAVLSLHKPKSGAHNMTAPEHRDPLLLASRLSLFRDPLQRKTEASVAPAAEPAGGAVVDMRLVGANTNPKVSGEEQLAGKSNYFIGNDPKKWRTNIPSYAKVRAENVYRGVDLVYYGNQGQLEYDFVVHPGADPSAIKLGLSTSPSAGQAGKSKESSIAKVEDEVTFTIREYDKTKPLVVDPVLSYSTYLGGGTPVGPYATTSANAIAVDGNGSAYVTGSTATSDFPTTPYAFQGTNHSTSGSNAFVAKFSLDGSTLLYSTYLGGSGGETAYGVAVDSAGDAYVTGTTRSTDFPTVSPFQATGHWNTFFCCSNTSFVTKLNATGTGLVYSTYLGSGTGGGEVGDVARGIVVDGSGNAYVTGYTDSADFPTANAIQPTNHSRSDPATNGFVTEFNASGSTLVYSTYLGGSGNASGGDTSNAIAVDSAGSAYVTGFTRSTDFPTTPSALQPACTPGPAGCNEGFVTKIGTGGSTLAYSTYLSQAGWGDGVAVDSSGNAYVTGIGTFVAKLNPDGSGMVYFTQLFAPSGNGPTVGTGIALGGPGFAFITGYTYSNTFPMADAIQSTNDAYASGRENAFVAQLTPDGAGLVFSTYLGGSNSTEGNGIAVDGSSNIYVTGWTSSSDFPTTANAFQSTNRTFNGSFYTSTGFVSKISSGAADLDIANSAPSVALSGSTLTYSITLTNNGPDAASNLNIQDAIPAGTNFNSVATTSGSCTAPAPGGTGAVNCNALTLASGGAITETLTVNVTAGLLSTISDTATVSSTTFDPTSGDHSATATTTVVGLPTIGGLGAVSGLACGRRALY
jgi:uncharacterized repeat protein (TIGR01451 family)